MARLGWKTAAVLLGVSCTYQGTPVPIAGDTKLLEGEWVGTYSSQQSGRSGSIEFRLKAGTDSAYGDVVMIPAHLEEVRPQTLPQMPEAPRKLPRLLQISFVRCEDGVITGRLDPYEDPDTGERIYTTFEGRLRGNEFRGSFSAHYPGSGRLVAGKWSVKRRRVT